MASRIKQALDSLDLEEMLNDENFNPELQSSGEDKEIERN